MASSSQFDDHQKVLEEHQELKKLMATIERMLQERSASIDEVGKVLGQLGDRLVKHFALEEEGGYFSEALLQAPRLVSRANELLEQHPKMCTTARKLAAEARRGDGSESWWDETTKRFQAFTEELLKHESTEDTLIQEAYTQDLGATD